MPKEHVLKTKFIFVVKNNFSDELCSLLRLYNMLKENVFATKINFVVKIVLATNKFHRQNSLTCHVKQFNNKFYSLPNLFDMLNDHVLTRKINFVAKNSFRDKNFHRCMCTFSYQNQISSLNMQFQRQNLFAAACVLLAMKIRFRR